MNLLPEPYAPPIYDCGKCARCLRKLRRKKIKSIVFGALWMLWAMAGLSGLGMAWNQAHQPPTPVSAEQRAQNERLGEIDTAMDALQNERDEIDPPPEPEPPDARGWP